MIYKVIGLMSGSSLDGLDIVYAQLEEVRGKWSAEILHATCVPYEEQWLQDLRNATTKDVPSFLRLHTAYGRYLGDCVHTFMTDNELEHKVHFIASHGHTVFHDPAAQTTCQIGDGASIAAVTGLPVINDLRALDMALGGQGAPIVPIGDRLLFAEYGLLLNLGGIANITVCGEDGVCQAFDICVANQALNYLAALKGQAFDASGNMAASGKVLADELTLLQQQTYYAQAAPKSLSNEGAMALVAAFVSKDQYSVEDRLCTVVALIAAQVAIAVKTLLTTDGIRSHRLLVTGGGALNDYLLAQLQQQLSDTDVEVVVPDENTIRYKEALVMALIGTLRWREEVNVLSGATGSRKDSVGGAFWIGA